MFKEKLVILCVGAPKSGKTRTCNKLSSYSETLSLDYRPTRGVRILELEKVINLDQKRTFDVAIELWDCSDSAEIDWKLIVPNPSVVMVLAENDSDPIITKYSQLFPGVSINVFCAKPLSKANKKKPNAPNVTYYGSIDTNPAQLVADFDTLLTNSLQKSQELQI